MSAYRPLGPFPQYFLADGTVNNGGLITFYETDLTTLQNTYSDDGLTIVNANPVVLDASGRPTTDIWGSGIYGVVITDSLGANARTLNNIEPYSGSGATIPSLVNGDFLTNDGSNLLWQAITQVPDPTGFSGDVLGTDGTLVFWQGAPVVDEPDITIGSNSFQAGTSSNPSYYLVQMGTGTAPASGTPNTSIAITFPTAFTTCLHMGITRTVNLAGQSVVSYLSANPIATGATVYFSVPGTPSALPTNIVNDITFTWIAHGFITP